MFISHFGGSLPAEALVVQTKRRKVVWNVQSPCLDMPEALKEELRIGNIAIALIEASYAMKERLRPKGCLLGKWNAAKTRDTMIGQFDALVSEELLVLRTDIDTVPKA